MLEKKLI